MPARVRWRGTTAQRGYGRPHQAERERRLAAYRQGDPCAHCGAPITWWPVSVARRYLDLPHTADRSGYLPGLSCAKHNIAESNLRRQGLAMPHRAWPASRQW